MSNEISIRSAAKEADIAKGGDNDLFDALGALQRDNHLLVDNSRGAFGVYCDAAGAESLKSFGIDVHTMGSASKRMFPEAADLGHVVSNVSLKSAFTKHGMKLDFATFDSAKSLSR